MLERSSGGSVCIYFTVRVRSSFFRARGRTSAKKMFGLFVSIFWMFLSAFPAVHGSSLEDPRLGLLRGDHDQFLVRVADDV